MWMALAAIQRSAWCDSIGDRVGCSSGFESEPRNIVDQLVGNGNYPGRRNSRLKPLQSVRSPPSDERSEPELGDRLRREEKLITDKSCYITLERWSPASRA